MDFLYLDHKENEIFFIKDPLGLDGKEHTKVDITNKLNDLKQEYEFFNNELQQENNNITNALHYDVKYSDFMNESKLEYKNILNELVDFKQEFKNVVNELTELKSLYKNAINKNL